MAADEPMPAASQVPAQERQRLAVHRNVGRQGYAMDWIIRTHLYAATVQRSPADDRIIADHVEQAYLRASDVIKAMEAKE